MTLSLYGRLSVVALAIAAFGIVPAAMAQSTPPAGQADQDHKAHHPDGQQAKPGQSAPVDKPMGMMGSDGGMMCGEMQKDMKSMMSMMRDMMGMMSGNAGMMPPRVEGGLTALKAELKITEAQAPQWDRFAETLRNAAKATEAAHKQMMGTSASTLPDRLKRRDALMSAHLASLKSVEEAVAPLYSVLSDEQKKIADRAMIPLMGMM